MRSQNKLLVLLGWEHVLPSTTNGEYKSCVTGVSYVVSVLVRECMLQTRITQDPLDDKQITFFMWAWTIGETDRKKKLSSRQAERLMILHGTVEGQW